jgi:hypothetical protein
MSRTIEVQIIGDASRLEKSFRQASDSGSRFGSALSKLGTMAKLGTAGLTAGVVVGLKKSVDAAIEAEAAQRRMLSALDQAGVSYQQYGSAIEAAVQKTSRLAAVDDEQLQDAFSRLVRTTGDVKQSLEGMSLAADIARARGISLEASTKMVERAMLGNEQAFKRVGVAMEKGASVQETLAAAQEKFGGAAAEYGASAAAAQERLGIAFENLQETIGAKLLPAFTRLLEGLNSLIAWAQENWPRFQQAAEAAFERVRAAAQALVDYYRSNLQPAIEAVVSAIKAIWQRFGNEITSVVKAAFDQVKNVVQTVLGVIRGVITTVTALIRGDWATAWSGIKQIFSSVWSGIVNTLKNSVVVIKAAATAIGKAIFDGVEAGVKGLGSLIEKLMGYIIQAIRGAAGNALSAAAAFGKAIYNGIIGALKGLGSALVSLIVAPINAIIGKINSISIPGFSVDLPKPFPDIHFGGVDPIPHIPTLAKGGIVDKPTIAVIGEAGPEAVIPLRHGMLAGGTTINVYASGYTDQQALDRLIRQIDSAVARRQARNN